MPNNKKIENIVLRTIGFMLLSAIIYMQYIILQPNRGSAMGMGFFIELAPLIIFLTPFLVLIINKYAGFLYDLGLLIIQIIFFIYLINKIIFNYKVNTDVIFYKDNFNDLFSPSSLELGFVFVITLSIMLYTFYKMLINNLFSCYNPKEK